MLSHIENVMVSISHDYNMAPEKAKELAEIGSDMTFNMNLEHIVPQLGNVIDNEPALREFLISMLKLGAIKYNYDLGDASEDE